MNRSESLGIALSALEKVQTGPKAKVDTHMPRVMWSLGILVLSVRTLNIMGTFSFKGDSTLMALLTRVDPSKARSNKNVGHQKPTQ